jgi:hypothetical protein
LQEKSGKNIKIIKKLKKEGDCRYRQPPIVATD